MAVHRYSKAYVATTYWQLRQLSQSFFNGQVLSFDGMLHKQQSMLLYTKSHLTTKKATSDAQPFSASDIGFRVKYKGTQPPHGFNYMYVPS